MYVFINDLSINPPGVNIQDNWHLLDTVMDISFKLKEEYLLEKVRVPNNFMSTPIANSRSINDYLVNGVLDSDEINSLLDFLANRTDEPDNEIRLNLEEAQIDKIFYAYSNGISSDLLTEAHVMEAPILSFVTSGIYKSDHFHSQLEILTVAGNETIQNISLKNFHDPNSIITHASFLIEWKKKIIFRDKDWDPYIKPIWNESTLTTLTNINFPQSKANPTIKEGELMQVGKIVAEMNGWEYDSKTTKLNKNNKHLRSIYRSINGKKQYFLSIDFEKNNGAFELHKHNGTHLGEIDFLGTHPPKNANPNNNNDHDIKVN